MLGTILVGLLATHGAAQAGQQNQSAGEYAATLNWDAKAKGPLLYLPYRRLMTKDKPGLQGGFTTMTTGSLTVIAPAQMTVIDPDYQQPANVYDGLPRKLKVMYLASTFTQDQWKTACTKGIGLSDMNKEQATVYRSILPSTFAYQTSPVWRPGSHPYDPAETTKTTLTPEQEAEVRLRIYKEMTLGVKFTDGGFSAIAIQTWDRYKPGSKRSSRIDEVSEDTDYAFGVQVRKTTPNQPKLSNLDYKSPAFNMPFPLKPASTVKELCQTASDLTHLTILADARFQGQQVTAVGSPARCGDVLRGLALCLTGAYRRVGNTYVLTSDLEGVGTEMTKLAFWHWNLKQIAEKESEKWEQTISANPGIQSIAYAADDPYTPSPLMRQFMDSDHDQGDKTMSASDLSPIWQQLLNGKDLHFAQPPRTDIAEPWDEVFWDFVAPGDQILSWEGELCDMNEFTHYSDRHTGLGPFPAPKKLALGTLPSSALVYQSEDPAAAAGLPQLAKTHGFTELWLQTTNAKALQAALDAGKAAGVTVKLVVEPFTVEGDAPKDQLDRTILGQAYSQAEALIQGSEWERQTDVWLTSNERPVDYLDESSPYLDAYWNRLGKLSTTAGLAGTVALSVLPVGYEKQSDWPEYEPPQLGAPLDLGYTVDLREKFLQANSVDPIDLLEVRDQFDLQPLEQSISSFGELNDYTYGKVGGAGDRDLWDKLRWKANEDRLKQFESHFTSPLLVEWRRAIHDNSLQWDSVVSAPIGDAPTGIMTADPSGQILTSDAFYLKRVGYPLSPGAADFMARGLAKRMEKQSSRLAVDLRAVPPDQLDTMLKLLFTPM